MPRLARPSVASTVLLLLKVYGALRAMSTTRNTGWSTRNILRPNKNRSIAWILRLMRHGGNRLSDLVSFGGLPSTLFAIPFPTESMLKGICRHILLSQRPSQNSLGLVFSTPKGNTILGFGCIVVSTRFADLIHATLHSQFLEFLRYPGSVCIPLLRACQIRLE